MTKIDNEKTYWLIELYDGKILPWLTSYQQYRLLAERDSRFTKVGKKQATRIFIKGRDVKEIIKEHDNTTR